MPAKPYIAVIGGATKDIGAKSVAPLVSYDSNPACISVSFGGVARNIAHNLRLLGKDVNFITALGDDEFSKSIKNSCSALGMDMTSSLLVSEANLATYMFIADSDGEMALAASDMKIFDKLDVSYFKKIAKVLNDAKLIVLDTNIPEDSINWIAKNCNVPIFVDPVSTSKAKKINNCFNYIHTIKPNKIELETITGLSIANKTDLDKAIDFLFAGGLKRVFVSLAENGVYCASHTSRVHVLPPPSSHVNATGCGDAFMAAIAASWIEGHALEQTGRMGVAAASIALEGALTINPLLNITEVKLRAELASIKIQ